MLGLFFKVPTTLVYERSAVLLRSPNILRITVTFELVQLIRPRYTSTLQKDGQTDERLTIAIPRFVVRALCGKTRKPSCR